MGTRCADHATPLYPQKLALPSLTGGGRSVGIVRSRTKATEYNTCAFYVCSLIRSISSSPPPSGTNTVIITLFSKIFSPHSYPNVRDEVSHAHKTTNKITVLYVLNSRLYSYIANGTTKHSRADGQYRTPECNQLLVAYITQFSLVIEVTTSPN